MPLVASNAFFHDSNRAPVREILLALLVAVLFAPLKGQIQRAFDRYLYREPYDYQRTIRETSRALSATIDLPALLGHFARTVGATLRPEGLAIYLLDVEEDRFERAHLHGHGTFPKHAPRTVSLLVTLDRERCLLFRDEVGRQSDGGDAVTTLGEFDHLGAEVLVPLIADDHVIGFLAVGPKRSGDPFFSDDADLLATLANQSAVAVRNAQIHQQVVQVNEHIQRILATIESGVAAVGAKGRITLFNRAAETLAGISAEELQGKPVAHLPGPLARLLEAAAGGGSSSQVEITLPDASGQMVPLMCSTSPLVGPRGIPLGAVAVFSDLSRLKELEQEKRRAERLASLEAIASGMVHEIRNPLVSLKAFTQLLPTRFDDPEFRARLVRVADREISRIDELLGRFRTLASAPAQPMGLVDLLDPLQSALELLLPEREARGVQLRRVGIEPVPKIVGNDSLLEQLFHNLCLNAIEAMAAGGELTVRVADLCEAGGSTLLVEISDTGCGIPDHLLDNIFNPFVTTKSRGSGLGLAICSSVADAHRAILSARNHTGRTRLHVCHRISQSPTGVPPNFTSENGPGRLGRRGPANSSPSQSGWPCGVHGRLGSTRSFRLRSLDSVRGRGPDGAALCPPQCPPHSASAVSARGIKRSLHRIRFPGSRCPVGGAAASWRRPAMRLHFHGSHTLGRRAPAACAWRESCLLRPAEYCPHENSARPR